MEVVTGKRNTIDAGRPTLELIVQDEEGHKIGVNVKNGLMSKFETLLKEEEHYILSKVAVVDNLPKFRCIHWSNEYKLTFDNKTGVTSISSDEWCGSNGFHFIPFEHLRDCLLDVGVTADVIGRVHSFSDLKHHGSGAELKNTYINLELKDLSGELLSCTLWAQFSKDFHEYMNKSDPSDFVVLIIQFGRTKDYKQGLSVTTHWDGSKIYLDGTNNAIVDYRQRLIESHSSQHSSETLAPSRLPTGTDPTLWFSGVKTVRLDVLQPNMIGVYVVRATIYQVVPNERWSYIACRKCNRGANPVSTNVDLTLGIEELLKIQRKCPKCGPNPNVFLRYKVPVRVENETGTASFTVFEGIVEKFLKTSAIDLQKTLPDQDETPEELDVLLGHSILFKFEVSSWNSANNNRNYTVKDAKSDQLYLDIYSADEKYQKVISEAPIDVDVNDSSSSHTYSTKYGSNQPSSMSNTVDLSGISGDSPPKKTIKQEPGASPMSVKSSSSKVKRSLNEESDI